MKALTFVWGFVAFTILGLDFLSKTDSFDALQDFESNFEIVDYPEDFLPNWSANAVRSNSSRVFQAIGEGTHGSQALGIQAIGSFNAEIYIKTTTKGFNSNRFSLKAKTKRNGSGNRPVHLFYSFARDGEAFSNRQQMGDNETFKNEDSGYLEYDALIPESFLEEEIITIKLEINYGEGSGTAARLFIDDFVIEGLLKEQAPEPLRILSTKSDQANTLIIQFNQPITLGVEEHSALNQGYGQPNIVRITEDTLFLEFEDHLYSNQYQLRFGHVASSITGETWSDTTYVFEIISPSPAGSLLINELMADPNPKGLVPEDPVLPQSADHEYIELYNTTNKPIWLTGFLYNHGTIEEVTVGPGEFVLLTSPAHKELFSSLGTTVAVNPFRALPNTSGQIVISDAFGNVVDSLSYSQTWYGSAQKRSGGWALERVNPFLPCSDQDNWKASISPQGGTPGRVNSVFDESPDNRPFDVTSILTVTSRQLRVGFSKALSDENLLDADFRIEGKPLSHQVIDAKTLTLTLPFDLISGHRYLLEVNGLSDCTGRALLENGYAFIYDAEGPKISRVSSLAADELLVFFDEAIQPSSAEEVSHYQINQNAESVVSTSLMDSVTVHLALKAPLEMNRYHNLLAKDLQDVHGNVSDRLESEFLMEDRLDTVIWAGSNLLDLHFHISLDSASVSNISNFSVDRGTGSPVRSFLNNENRKLVHLIFEQNLPVNTDLTLTSQNLKDSLSQYINSHKKSLFFDNRAIAVTGVHVANDSTLHLGFNKSLDPDFASIKNNYVINKGIGQPLSIQLIQADSVILTVKQLIEGQEYTLSVSGLRDIYGMRMSRIINRDFVFDLSGPEILEAFLLSPYHIRVKTNEAVVLPIPDEVLIDGRHAAQIEAIAADEFLITSTQEITTDLVRITIQSLADLNGNQSETVTAEIQNENITLGAASIINETLLQLVFTKRTDPISTVLLEKYLINGQIPEEVHVQDTQFEVLLSLSKPLLLLDSVLVEIRSLKSIHGKESQDIVQRLWYDDQVEDLFVVNPQLIQILHKIELDKAFAESGVYYLQDESTELQPIINQSDLHVLQLALSHPLKPNTAYDLVVPTRQDHAKNSIPGSTRSILYDKQPPALTAIDVLNEREILVSFDEDLDPILALITAFYSLNGEEPTEIIPAEQAHQVILVFNTELAKDNTYLLTVKHLEDLYRNALEEDSLEFIFDGPVAPAYKDIVINEIMAAPRAGLELPEVEYIELFNTSQNVIALGGLVFANSRSSTVLPRANLQPGEFILLTAANQEEALEAFGITLGLSNWPTLINGGDELRLLDRHGDLLDEIHYSTASYSGSEKAQGGYSLEVVNPFAICTETENLKPSASPQRGTPGQINSVFDDSPDQVRPSLQKAIWQGEKKIILQFSKRLHDDLDQVKITFSPGMNVESILIDETNPNQLVLTLSEVLKENTPYLISVDNLRDCPGNLIDPAANATTLILPIKARAGNIVLNEILFNPKTGYPKFVEIYNQSPNYIDLQGWKLANIANAEVANRRIVTEEPLIMAPFSFMVFTTDASLLKQAYLRGKEETFVELSSLPSYPQASGAVILLSPEEELLERFDYDEKFHHTLLDEVRGISLERLLVNHPTNDAKNWHSASAALGYATPGYKNSHAQGEGTLEKGITISPQIFVPDTPGEQSFTTINYQMDHPGFVATMRIYSVSGQLIQELCQNDVWGSSGFYTWDGTNLSGSKVRPGYYIVWVEILNLEGRVENIKKTVVVGSKF